MSQLHLFVLNFPFQKAQPILCHSVTTRMDNYQHTELLLILALNNRLLLLFQLLNRHEFPTPNV